MIYPILRTLLKLFFGLFTRLETSGLHNLPASGGFIVAANHLGRLDVALVYHLLDRRDVYLLVAEKYRKYAIFRWLVRNMDAVFVERFGADFRALREMLNRLQRGGVLVIAPEGTRSPTGALIEGKPGGSYLAVKAGVPIVPVAVTGTADRYVLEQFSHLRRLHLHVRVGHPFELPPVDKKNREAALQAHTEEIMCRIAALLPPESRGVYAGYPRVRELLESGDI
jgi:1-acyl-sn-glycerol-3-phosphate acyltransferase